LFDLDDTLLSEGRLTEAAYSALHRLKESGLLLILVTGRPANWAELLVGIWPIDGAIAENGALAYQRMQERVTLLDSISTDERECRRERLRTLVSATMKAFPQLVPADDVQGRLSDFTFD